MDHETIFKIDLTQTSIKVSEVTKLKLFKNNLSESCFSICIVENQPDFQEEDKISIFQISQDFSTISPVIEIFASKVQAICLNASIQNSGFERSTNFYQDNSYYIDVTDSNLEGNPILKNFQSNFGFENEEAETSNKPPYLLIQTIEKKI